MAAWEQRGKWMESESLVRWADSDAAHTISTIRRRASPVTGAYYEATSRR